MLSTYSDRAIPSKWEISLNSFSMILSLATFFHRTSALRQQMQLSVLTTMIL